MLPSSSIYTIKNIDSKKIKVIKIIDVKTIPIATVKTFVYLIIYYKYRKENVNQLEV